jgi:hypothetical protein
MNTEELRKKLLAAARANPPGDHVPLAFEKRILAHLAAKPAADIAALWARALWRAAVPCVAVTVLLGAFSFMPTSTPTNVTNEEDLSQTFEQSLLASSDQQEELW